LTRASEAAHQASHQSWDELLAPALLQQGLAERHLGRLDQAEENLKAACSLFEGLFEVRGHGRSLLGLGRVAEQRGDFDQAAIYFDGGRDLFERSGDMLGVAQSLNALGDIARQSQDYSLARSYSNQALQTSKNIGYQIGVADGLNDIAEWDRLQGDLDSARARCIEARDLYRALGSQKSQFVELNLGLIHLEQGDFAEASKIFERLEMDFRSTQQWSLLAHAMVGLLPGYADNGNWEAFDWCFHEAVRLLEQTGINDPNITIAARIGAIVADEAGELSRAEALRKIIRSQREAITSSQVLRRIVVEDE
ncbi:MAG: tetratricopeptide repeat protein, partial [Bradymonadaceae bacterium]